MQITLNQEEIITALKDYALKVINVAPGNDITIDLKAGRGDNGYSATLDIVPQQMTESHKPTVPTPRGTSIGDTAGKVYAGGGGAPFKETIPSGLQASYAETAPEVPVEGEAVIDTKPPVEDNSDKTDAQIEQEVEEYLESAKPTRSLFSRPE